MRAVGSFFYVLALALWVGGGALYTFVLTPAIFAAYHRNTAGEIVGTMMPHYFRFQLAVAAMTAIILIALWRLRPARRALCLALVLVGLLALVSVQFWLYPRMLDAKSRVASFESAPEAPERKRFKTLHGVSMLINVLYLADGTLLLALARRPD